MPVTEVDKLVSSGIDAINRGNTVSALVSFERAIQIKDTPLSRSYFAFCIARERGQFKRAVSLCEEAIKEEPRNTVHYLNLGRVHMLSGHKQEAMRIYREGLNHGENREILDELNKLGMRRPPVIPVLSRNNFLNKYIGLVLSRLGLR